MTSEEKSEFVRGCLQGLIFTSSMIPDHDWVRMVPRVFMPVAFGCLQVSVPEPQIPDEIPEDMSVEEFEQLHTDKEKIFARYEKLKEQLQKEFNDQLGIVWEWNDKALPRSINGYPIFMSCRIMNKEDWEEILPVLQENQRVLNDIAF